VDNLRDQSNHAKPADTIIDDWVEVFQEKVNRSPPSASRATHEPRAAGAYECADARSHLRAVRPPSTPNHQQHTPGTPHRFRNEDCLTSPTLPVRAAEGVTCRRTG
jgi:hypothetical protein